MVWYRRALVSFGMAVATVAISLAEPARAQGPSEPSDGIALPDRSVTTTSDATSLEVNPAGLGFTETAELRYGFDLLFPGGGAPVRDQHGVFLGAGNDWIGGGFSMQWLDRPTSGPALSSYQKFTLGLALRPFDNLSLGGAVHLFGSIDSRSVNQLASLDLGAQWRPSQFVGAGLAIEDTTRPFFRPDRGVPVRVRPGVALRLLGGGLVLDSELGWTPDRGTLFATPRVSLQPTDGLRLYGRAAVPVNSNARERHGSDIGLTAGLEVSLGRIGLEAGGSLRTGNGDSSGLTRHTQQVRFSTAPRQSLVDPVRRWVQFELSGTIPERGSSRLLGGSSRGFLELLTKIRAAGDDPGVDGVLLRISSNSLGYGRAWELRRAIEQLEASDTASATFLEQPGFLESYIASAADRVFMLPNELYEPAGLRVTKNSYGRALANIGVEAEFVRIGEYKAAPESFVRESPSEPALEQTNAYVDDIHEEVVGGIGEDRSLEPAEVQRAVDSIPLYPDEAVADGFVDDILYPDELRPLLLREYGAARLVEEGYDPNPEPEQGWNGAQPIVAVVYVDGSIIRGESAETPFTGQILTGSSTVVDTLERLGQNPRVEGIVLRVDSPGGSAVASDLIYRAVRRVQQVKPVVASMGDVAASGGYYVASAAETIFATPNTLTGSIGIFAGKFNVQRLASWIGVSHESVERGERSGRFDLYSSWSAEQRASVARSIEYLYELFLHRASRNRPFGPEALDDRARGRVWSGAAAHERELVDELGGLVDAVRRVERMVGLEPGTSDYRAYPERPTFLDLPGATASPVRKLVRRLRGNPEDDTTRDTAVGQFLRQLERAARLPLHYRQGEALMLPPRPIELHDE